MLNGDADADTLDGEAGDDQLWGGTGSDRFVFSGINGGLESGADTVKDLGAGDTLYFANVSRMDILNHTEIYAYGSNTYIMFAAGSYLTLENCTDVSLVRGAIRGSLTINQWDMI